MFYYISGTLVHKDANFAVVDASGVGYKIHTSMYSLGTMGDTGAEIKMYTFLYVREDTFDLYGFLSAEEMDLFQMLISVSGVGPKAALSLLSCMPPHRLAGAIVTGDSKLLTQAQGIGPKAAQRVILELKDKLKNEDMTENGSAGLVAAEAFGYSGEAAEALVMLGYSQSEAKRALAGVDMNQDIELIIKSALKKLAR